MIEPMGSRGREKPVAYLISMDVADSSKVIRLRACLQDVAARFGGMERECRIEEHEQGGRQYFAFSISGGVQADREFRRSLAEALSDFVCDSLEPEMVRSMIQKSHPFYGLDEVAAIQGYVSQLLESSAWECSRVVYGSRRDKLARQISRFLRENRQLAVDGFTRFRMKTYRMALAACVRDAVHEYTLDREYQEFIQLLRQFVTLQPARYPLVHVVHDGRGRFRLFQADGTPLEWREMMQDARESPDPACSHEDALVGALLAAAPERVVLHSKNPSENVIRTLIQIFKGRIMVCDGCSQCGLELSFREDA
jgi:putative sporulation protein YtxC